MAGQALATEYAGRRGPLLRLALSSSLLTVLTLGFYRFWMKTRLRRYYWSAIRPGGHPLEYAGLPVEKLLGFLIAVVFLAFYIGIVNLLLMFFSFSVLNTSLWAYVLSFAGVLPVLFYARYRARRYILARTRWRGVRFGLEKGAWGYAVRALLYWGLTILSAGVLWPLMTFRLEKYRTDRTMFGSAHFVQGGRWTMLLAPFLFAWIGAVGLLAVLGLRYMDRIAALRPYAEQWQLSRPALVWVVSSGAIWLVFGIVLYKAISFRKLANTKSIGTARLQSQVKIWRVGWIYISGYALVGAAVAALLVGFGFAYVLILRHYGVDITKDNAFADLSRNVPAVLTTGLPVVAYFAVFVLWGVLRHVLVSLPLARQYARTLSLSDEAGIAGITQIERDDMEHADGFAEALDVGAAI